LIYVSFWLLFSKVFLLLSSSYTILIRRFLLFVENLPFTLQPSAPWLLCIRIFAYLLFVNEVTELNDVTTS